MTLTNSRRRALEIVRDHGPIGGAAFGYRMWPQHATKNRRLRPQGAGFSGGGYLGKLRMAGLVTQVWDKNSYCGMYVLTVDGYAAIREATQ